MDSPLEGEGFELRVPLARKVVSHEEKWPEVGQGGLERPFLLAQDQWFESFSLQR
jgi:hypothetical protein